MSIQSKIEKTDTGEVIYNTKRDSGFQIKTNNSKKEKKSKAIGIGMSVLTQPHKSVSVIDNSQGLSPSFLPQMH